MFKNHFHLQHCEAEGNTSLNMTSIGSGWTQIATGTELQPGLEYVWSNANRAAQNLKYAQNTRESRASRIIHDQDGNAVAEPLVTLTKFVSLLARSNVRGPLHFTEPNLDSLGAFLGRGSQWEVFTDGSGIMENIVFKRVK